MKFNHLIMTKFLKFIQFRISYSNYLDLNKYKMKILIPYLIVNQFIFFH